MYIVGQERRLVDPPSQVVAGVRTVTTHMNRRCTLPRCSACSLFKGPIFSPLFSVVIIRYTRATLFIPLERIPPRFQALRHTRKVNSLLLEVNQYRREFAAYTSQLELAHYDFRAGFTDNLNIEPVYDRFGDLFTLDSINSLKLDRHAAQAHNETERAALGGLLGLAQVGYLDEQAKELTNEIARQELASKIRWDGEDHLSRGVSRILANEPSANRRRDLYARWEDATAAVDDLRAERIESFHKSAVTLGASSYRSLFADITGTDYEQLARKVAGFLTQTEEPYQREVRRLAERDLPDVARDDLQHADYLVLQRFPSLDKFFPSSDVLPTYSAGMRGLGIDIRKQGNVHIDDELRPSKHPRAACFRINPPEDVRLVVAPIGGVYDYTTLFHEAGHAQHFAWTSKQLAATHPEFVHSADYATTEGYAFLLNHLLIDPHWLKDHRHGISIEQSRKITRDLAFLTMSTIRRFCAKLNYDILLHDSSQIRTQNMAAAYSRLQTEATGFKRSSAFYLSDVDDGFYSGAYLRAWLFEAGLREYLLTRYGRRWWASTRAGDELIDLWNTGSRYSVEELSQMLGLGELSFDLLAETWISAMSEE